MCMCVLACVCMFTAPSHLLIYNAGGSPVFSRFPFLFQNSKKLQPTASNCFQCCWSPCAHWGCRRRRGGGRSGIFIFARPSNTLRASPGTHSLHFKVAICNDRHFHRRAFMFTFAKAGLHKSTVLSKLCNKIFFNVHLSAFNTIFSPAKLKGRKVIIRPGSVTGHWEVALTESSSEIWVQENTVWFE